MNIEYSVTVSKADVMTYMLANMPESPAPKRADSKSEALPVVPEGDTIRSRVSTGNFNNDQISVACLARIAGASEAEILEWFRPEVSAEQMEQARLEQAEKKTRKK